MFFNIFLINIRDFCWHILNDPFEDNDEKIDKFNTFIKITNVKFEIDIIYFQNFYSKKQSKKYDCLNLNIIELIIESIIFFYNRFISPNIALSYNRIEHIIYKNNHKATIIVHLFYIIIFIPFFPEQSQNLRSSILNKKK